MYYMYCTQWYKFLEQGVREKRLDFSCAAARAFPPLPPANFKYIIQLFTHLSMHVCERGCRLMVVVVVSSEYNE